MATEIRELNQTEEKEISGGKVSFSPPENVYYEGSCKLCGGKFEMKKKKIKQMKNENNFEEFSHHDFDRSVDCTGDVVLTRKVI